MDFHNNFSSSKYLLDDKYNKNINIVTYNTFPNFILPTKNYYFNNEIVKEPIFDKNLQMNLDFSEKNTSMLETIVLDNNSNNILNNIPLQESIESFSDIDIEFIEKDEIKDYKEDTINVFNYIFPIDYSSLFRTIFKN